MDKEKTFQVLRLFIPVCNKRCTKEIVFYWSFLILGIGPGQNFLWQAIQLSIRLS